MKPFDRLIIGSNEEEMKQDFNSQRSHDFLKKKKKTHLSHSNRNLSPQYHSAPQKQFVKKGPESDFPLTSAFHTRQTQMQLNHRRRGSELLINWKQTVFKFGMDKAEKQAVHEFNQSGCRQVLTNN